MWGTTLVGKRVEVTKECHVLSLLHSPRIACLAGSALESDLLSVAISVPLVALCPGDRVDSTGAEPTGPEAAAIAHREWLLRVAKAGLMGVQPHCCQKCMPCRLWRKCPMHWTSSGSLEPCSVPRLTSHHHQGVCAYPDLRPAMTVLIFSTREL